MRTAACRSKRLADRSQDQMQGLAWQQFPERSPSAMKTNAFTAIVAASMSTQLAPLGEDNTVHSPPAHRAGRPSAGGRLATGCSRVKNTMAASRIAVAVWPEATRNSRASGRQSSKPQVLHPAQAHRVRPNPSLERTSTSWPRSTALLFSVPRGQPVASAQLKR